MSKYSNQRLGSARVSRRGADVETSTKTSEHNLTGRSSLVPHAGSTIQGSQARQPSRTTGHPDRAVQNSSGRDNGERCDSRHPRGSSSQLNNNNKNKTFSLLSAFDCYPNTTAPPRDERLNACLERLFEKYKRLERRTRSAENVRGSRKGGTRTNYRRRMFSLASSSSSSSSSQDSCSARVDDREPRRNVRSRGASRQRSLVERKTNDGKIYEYTNDDALSQTLIANARQSTNDRRRRLLRTQTYKLDSDLYCSPQERRELWTETALMINELRQRSEECIRQLELDRQSSTSTLKSNHTSLATRSIDVGDVTATSDRTGLFTAELVEDGCDVVRKDSCAKRFVPPRATQRCRLMSLYSRRDDEDLAKVVKQPLGRQNVVRSSSASVQRKPLNRSNASSRSRSLQQNSNSPRSRWNDMSQNMRNDVSRATSEAAKNAVRESAHQRLPLRSLDIRIQQQPQQHDLLQRQRTVRHDNCRGLIPSSDEPNVITSELYDRRQMIPSPTGDGRRETTKKHSWADLVDTDGIYLSRDEEDNEQSALTASAASKQLSSIRASRYESPRKRDELSASRVEVNVRMKVGEVCDGNQATSLNPADRLRAVKPFISGDADPFNTSGISTRDDSTNYRHENAKTTVRNSSIPRKILGSQFGGATPSRTLFGGSKTETRPDASGNSFSGRYQGSASAAPRSISSPAPIHRSKRSASRSKIPVSVNRSSSTSRSRDGCGPIGELPKSSTVVDVIRSSQRARGGQPRNRRTNEIASELTVMDARQHLWSSSHPNTSGMINSHLYGNERIRDYHDDEEEDDDVENDKGAYNCSSNRLIESIVLPAGLERIVKKLVQQHQQSQQQPTDTTPS